jgi:hypothetical protein
MRPSFNECETKERQYLKDYLIPILNQKYNDLKYQFSEIDSKDRKDMLIEFKLNGEPKTAVYESKIRIDIKPYYEQQGLMLEMDKYKAIKELHPNIPFFYVMFLETHYYIFNMNKLISLYDSEIDMINQLYKRLYCNITTCGKPKGKKMKPCLLLPTNTTASIKIKYK